MAQKVKDFDFTSGDLNAFLLHVIGMNLVFRSKMLAVLTSEDNEMRQVRELFIMMVRRQETENIRLMDDDFQAGFITLFNMNATPEMQITE